MKKNLLKLAALILALAMVFSFAACKKNDTPDNGDETTSEAPVDGDNVSDDTNAAPEETSGEAVSGDESTEPSSENGAEASTDKSSSTAKPATPSAPVVTAAGNKAPSTTADVLKYYNASTSAAFTGKVGFTKHRETKNEQIEANALVKSFKSLIYKFMGIGADNAYNTTVTKGQWDTDARRQYLRASTLGTGDVTSATCKQSGSNYIITIKVKDGKSYATKGTATCSAPLDKSGICVGDEDKSYYDHKRASCIYDAIEGTYGNAKVSESYSGAVITATVNASNGHLVKLDVSFDIAVTIDLGALGSPTATGTSVVNYSNFKY